MHVRILIAEDENDLNQILTSRLKAEHYSVDSCKNGREVLEYMAGAEYDALILDIMMPVLDGLSVLKKIRQRGSTVPVLLLTAKDSIEDRVAGLDAGANDYLVKPFAFEELLARIRVLLRKPADAHRIAQVERRDSIQLSSDRRSEDSSGYPSGIPRRYGNSSLGERVFPAPLSDAERRHCAVTRQAGTAYLEL